MRMYLRQTMALLCLLQGLISDSGFASIPPSAASNPGYSVKEALAPCTRFAGHGVILPDHSLFQETHIPFNSAHADETKPTYDESLTILEKLLKDVAFSEKMAAHLNDAYNRNSGNTYPLYDESKAEEPSGLTVRDAGIAQSLAGFYALEAGVHALRAQPQRRGQSLVRVLQDIVADHLTTLERNLMMRMANLTWKASQPFRAKPGRVYSGSPSFVRWDSLNERTRYKDLVQIAAAAEKVLERVQNQSPEQQLAMMNQLLQDVRFAEEIAHYLNDAYNKDAGSDYPLYDTDKAGDPAGLTVKDAGIAQSLAGFYALETSVGALLELPGRAGQRLDQLLEDIVQGNLSDPEKDLVMRMANVSWKISQPFRVKPGKGFGGRIAGNPNMVSWDSLDGPAKFKDMVQIKTAAESVLMAIRERTPHSTVLADEQLFAFLPFMTGKRIAPRVFRDAFVNNPPEFQRLTENLEIHETNLLEHLGRLVGETEAQNVMKNMVKRALPKRLWGLFLEPQMALRSEEFISFYETNKAKQGDLSALELRLRFIRHLGFRQVVRAVYRTSEEVEQIWNSGLHQDGVAPEIVSECLLSEGLDEFRRNERHLAYEGSSKRRISLSFAPEENRGFAIFAAMKMRQHSRRRGKLVVFSMSIPSCYLIDTSDRDNFVEPVCFYVAPEWITQADTYSSDPDVEFDYYSPPIYRDWIVHGAKIERTLKRSSPTDRHLLSMPMDDFGNPKKAIEFKNVRLAAESASTAIGFGWPSHEEADADNARFWKSDQPRLPRDEIELRRIDFYLMRLLAAERWLYGFTAEDILQLLSRVRLSYGKAPILNRKDIEAVLTAHPNQRYSLRMTSVDGPVVLYPENDAEGSPLTIMTLDGQTLFGSVSKSTVNLINKAVLKATQILGRTPKDCLQLLKSVDRRVRFELRRWHDYAGEEDSKSVILHNNTLQMYEALLLAMLEELTHVFSDKPDVQTTPSSIAHYLGELSKEAAFAGLDHLGLTQEGLQAIWNAAEEHVNENLPAIAARYGIADARDAYFTVRPFSIRLHAADGLARLILMTSKNNPRAAGRHLLGLRLTAQSS